jgi:hypothetical protein
LKQTHGLYPFCGDKTVGHFGWNFAEPGCIAALQCSQGKNIIQNMQEQSYLTVKNTLPC